MKIMGPCGRGEQDILLYPALFSSQHRLRSKGMPGVCLKKQILPSFAFSPEEYSDFILKHDGLIIQERDRHLLRELSLLRVVDREQARIVGGFTSARRVNRRLLALTRKGLLKRFFIVGAGVKKSLYSLSRMGAHFVKVQCRSPRFRKDELVTVSFSLDHQLCINEIYCLVKYASAPFDGARFVRWDSFYSPIDPEKSLIPDGYLEMATPQKYLTAFLELDLGHENLAIWKTKISKYVRYAITGEFERSFHHPQFRVVVVTDSERRRKALQKATATIINKIFCFTTMDSIRQSGFWSSIWFRPQGDGPISLL